VATTAFELERKKEICKDKKILSLYYVNTKVTLENV
jgi:hypothetical protein